MAASLGKMPTTPVRRLDLAVEPLQRVGRVDFRPVVLWGSSYRPGRRSRPRPSGQRVLAPWSAAGRPPWRQLGTGGLGVLLGKGGAGVKEATTRRPLLPACASGGTAHEVPHPAALPGGVQHLGDRGLEPLMGIRDDELDAAQAAPGQLAQKLDARRSRLPRANIQTAKTSRRPSLLTATAMITAVETMRPPVRALR